MASDPETFFEFQELKDFDRANSAAGLLLRYAHGRIRTIWFRLSVIASGVMLTAIYTNVTMAMVIFAIMATFEFAEFAILNRLKNRPVSRIKMVQANWPITLASTLQALGIGASIAIVGIQNDATRLAAWVFLIGVTLNSLLVARYHPPSHHARMGAYLVTVAAILLHQALVLRVGTAVILTELVAFGLMVAMLISLFRHLRRREMKMLTAERGMFQQSLEAQRFNRALTTTQENLAKREKEARQLALVAEHATDSVVLTDRFATIIWVNSQFSRLTGYSLSESVGRPVAELLDGPLTNSATTAKIIAARAQLRPIQINIQNYRKDGSTVWMEVSQTPVFDDNGQFQMFISVERDATISIRKSEELQAALKAANLADKEKSDFLARMSHELRTPANGVVGGVDLMGETALSAEQSEILSILKQGSDRMQVVVEDILSFCELSEDEMPLDKEQIDLGSLLIDIARNNRAGAKVKGVAGPIVHLRAGGDCSVMSDRSLLQRIFDALIGNAVKFTQKGRVDITLQATPVRNKLAITVEVRDTGVGIAPQDRERIFQKFTQADGKRTRAFDGAGLGLSIAQSCAHKLGGEITLLENFGRGSCFTVALCLEPVNKPRPIAQTTALGNPDLTMLVAEDNRTNRLLISTMFKNTKVHLEFAEDGVQAVEKYAEFRPDLVLMDVSMPNKDGLQAAREIRQFEQREKLPNCPILALTANTFESDRKSCFDAGMSDFLAKPVRKKTLIDAVESALESTANARNVY